MPSDLTQEITGWKKELRRRTLRIGVKSEDARFSNCLRSFDGIVLTKRFLVVENRDDLMIILSMPIAGDDSPA